MNFVHAFTMGMSIDGSMNSFGRVVLVAVSVAAVVVAVVAVGYLQEIITNRT